MSDPVYHSAEETLDGETLPCKYVVAIKPAGGARIHEEMTAPEIEGFVADFENRTQDDV